MHNSLFPFLAFCLLAPGVANAAPVDFQREVLPLLADRCFACHGPDANTREAGLRLDVEAEAKKEAIVPGQADASEVLKRILSTDPAEVMPPPKSQKPALTPEQADLIRRWIAEGAPWSGHWAFTPPVRHEAPAVNHDAWPRNEIDRFILQRLEKAGLTPSPEAPRETLIRRAYLDLTGLPPSLESIDAFLMDHSPDAYERMIDRLLTSPAYGEHMARHWLDGARYADTNGYQNDFQRTMWPWRDWVIGAFNDNMPYDQFLIEQLAGDLLPNATESQRIATGFNRNNKANTEGGSIEEEWQVENIVDRVETTSTVFMGLTMGCARCHDHKYDPVSQREFYQFYAFFNNTEDKGFYEETRGNTGPQVHLPSFEQQRKMNELDGAVNLAQRALEDERAREGGNFDAWLATVHAASGAVAPAPVYEAVLNGALPEAGPAGAPVAGAGLAWTGGLFGQALALDGSANTTVALGDAVRPEIGKPFSIALWAKPEAAGALVSRMDEARGFRGFDLLVEGDGSLAAHIIHTWDNNAIKVITEPAFKLGTWNHIIFTWDGVGKADGLRFFVNGRPVGVKVVNDSLTGPLDTTEPLRIGQRTSSNYLRGTLSHLQVFDRALEEGESRLLQESALAAAFPAGMSEEQGKALREYFDGRIAFAVRAQQEAVDQAHKARAEFAKEIPSVMVMQERTERRPTYLLKRGAYDAPDTSEELFPATPEFLPEMKPGAPRNRLGLAQWLADPANPLTARVAVNMLWQNTFGTGLVKTTEDFGLQASPPSHPELLDYLALRFVESGWDMKALLREMVTSATYRQSSVVTEALLAADPEGTLYSRAPRLRLAAEAVRDNALLASGLLVDRVGGPSVMTYQPEGLWDELAGGAGQGPYVQAKGADLYRRSLYTYRKRTVPHPTLTTFDAPGFDKCQVRRYRTNTPLQSLALLNGPTYVEAARKLAERMMGAPDADTRERIALGFRLATGRRPTPQELDTLSLGYEGFAAKYNGNPEAAAQLLTNGESPVAENMPKQELAAYTTVAGVLLNLDEAITRE